LHKSTCEQETVADLFSEQSLLCSTLPYSALKSFNKLVQNGIDPEVAYFECWYELKLIVDTLVKIGPYQFFKLISPNALLGSEIGKNLFYDMDYDKKLDDMLKNIQSGNFVDSIKGVNFEDVKSEVLDFWKDQKINTLHNDLKDELFKG
jgi:ketol-acid reductoisomerase